MGDRGLQGAGRKRKEPATLREPPEDPPDHGALARPLFYLRDGTPCPDTLRWAKLFQDLAYRRIAETSLEDGSWISTVWMGIDHSLGVGEAPLIFETMVFRGRCNQDCAKRKTDAIEEAKTKKTKIEKAVTALKGWACDHMEERDMERYATEAQAKRGHQKMVMKWRSRLKIAARGKR